MPENRLSSVPVRARFVGARSLGVTATVDYHDGGVAIQDASLGLLYQRWTARLLDTGRDSSRVELSAPNTPAFDLYVSPGITEISLSFDQNMRPALAYVDAGGSKLWWYDSTVPGYAILDVPGATPRIGLDDSRLIATQGYQTNDIILAYVRDLNLYYREQRERFGVERLLQADVTGGLIKLGQNRQLRLQFQMEIS